MKEWYIYYMRIGIRHKNKNYDTKKYTSYAHNITYEGEDEYQAFASSSFQITAHESTTII